MMTSQKFITDQYKWKLINKPIDIFENEYLRITSDSIQDSKYLNKSILLVGGGPSTIDRAWEKLDVDYIWTCNNFYTNPKLVNKKIDLVSLSNRVELDSKDFLSCIDNVHQIVFEPIHFHEKLNTNQFNIFYEKYKDRINFFDTKFQNKSGTIARLAILASLTGAKNIYIVGLDGHPWSKGFAQRHAFRPGWKWGWDERRNKPEAEWDYEVVKKDWNDMAIYLKKIADLCGVNLYNLGEGLEYNMFSKYSSNNFKLPEEILKVIK